VTKGREERFGFVHTHRGGTHRVGREVHEREHRRVVTAHDVGPGIHHLVVGQRGADRQGDAADGRRQRVVEVARENEAGVGSIERVQQGVRITQPLFREGGQRGAERSVVERNDRAERVGYGEFAAEPVELLGAETAAAGVQHENAHRVELDGAEVRGGVVGEGPCRVGVVVVAERRDHGGADAVLETRERPGERRVRRGVTALHQVTGDHDGLGRDTRVQRVGTDEVETLEPVDRPVEQLAVGRVHVADVEDRDATSPDTHRSTVSRFIHSTGRGMLLRGKGVRAE
jgi:hypothetical protein